MTDWRGLKARDRCLPIWDVFAAPQKTVTLSRIVFVAALAIALVAPWFIIDALKELP